MEAKKALLLVASPRNSRSTSQALGGFLLRQLQTLGLAVETHPLYPALADPVRLGELLDRVGGADLLLLAFPLYVDHLPAPLIRFLEMAHERCGSRPLPTALAAVVNCGFPETGQCRPAGDGVRLFCERSGIRFMGCLALGMGGFVAGRDLRQTGGMMRRQRRALELAAAALAAGSAIPADVIQQFGRPLMPRWLYTTVANWGFRRAARRAGMARRLSDRPLPAEAERPSGG